MFWEEVFSTTTLCGSTQHGGEVGGGANEGGEGGEGYSYDPPTSSHIIPTKQSKAGGGIHMYRVFQKKIPNVLS